MQKAQIESIAFGGDGIARVDHLVVFIPFTAPGDEVLFSYTEKKAHFARGKIDKILHEGEGRITPDCTYFGSCGGCQLQHLSYKMQCEVKRKFIEDALLRIGKIPFHVPPIVSSQLPYGYREHITLKFHGSSFGYTQCDGVHFLPVEHCPIFTQGNHLLFFELKQCLTHLSTGNELKGHIRIIKKDPNRFVLHLILKGHLPLPLLQEKLKTFLEHSHAIAGIALTLDGKEANLGDIALQKDILGLKIDFSPRAFMQNHLAQAENIYKYVKTLFEGKSSLLDLFSGSGITTLLFAQDKRRALGIENNPNATASASKNAQNNGISYAKFLTADVEEALPSLLEKETFEVLLLNPPRTGLTKKAKEALRKGFFSQIVYISCMPATLSRDMADFIQEGYELESVQGFDLFPQTTHVETVVVLKKK